MMWVGFGVNTGGVTSAANNFIFKAILRVELKFLFQGHVPIHI